MASEYEPEPIPVDHVVLSAEILALIERLAENAHDIWAAERLLQGWTHGPARDDARKQHPCLVPYQRLPENERDIDRAMISQSIRAMIALGVTISRDSESGHDSVVPTFD
jgi:hypothetical protein